MLEGVVRFVSNVGWSGFNCFVLNPMLGLMEALNPHAPGWVLQPVSWGLLKSSDVINHRPVLDILTSTGSNLIIPSVRLEYGDQDANDTKVFFHLGINGYRSDMGSGNTNDPENCFFPDSLATGPIEVAPEFAPMSERRNVEIAKTCALLSLLSYRHDDVIINCMQMGTPMLPNTLFFSAHTMEEGDLSVFVAENESWAVFCFRGTEPETLRDWCTSALLKNELASFSTGEEVPNRPGEVKVAKVRARYDFQMKTAFHRTDLDFQTGGWNPIPPDHSMTAFELASYLHRRPGCKIYYTGHSLGGGLATLMGAQVLAYTKLKAAGIISFGSPPVGDEDFCEWFNDNFDSHSNHVSWRFVNRDEFAPMAPPIPFTKRQVGRQFRHVGGLVLVEDLNDANSDQRALSQDKMEERLNELARDNKLTKIFMDHNLATTLRLLCEFSYALQDYE